MNGLHKCANIIKSISKKQVMKTDTIVEIIIVIILSIAFIVYLTRRNLKDEKDIDPELTKALEDAKKESKD